MLKMLIYSVIGGDTKRLKKRKMHFFLFFSVDFSFFYSEVSHPWIDLSEKQEFIDV